MKKKIYFLLLFVFISGCQFDRGISINSSIQSDRTLENGSVGEETKSSLSSYPTTDSLQADIEPTNTVESVKSQVHGTLEKVPLNYDSENISSDVNWYSNNMLYSIIRDYDIEELNFLLIDVSSQKYENSILSTFAKNVPQDKLKNFTSKFGETLKQIYVSPDKKEYLILIFPPEFGEIAINYYMYELWRYDEISDEYTLIIDQNSDFQSYCSMGVLPPSSVNILENTDYAYFYCFGDFGQIILNIKTGQFYKLFMDMGCYKGMGPIFAGNGKKVIVDDAIYWTKDYLDFVEECGLQENIEKKYDEDSMLYKEFAQNKLFDIPVQFYQGTNLYRLDYNADYYYYYEMANGAYDTTNNGNMVRVNILTGEKEIVIPAEELNNNVNISNLEIIVSPDGNRILLRSGNWQDYVYVYTMEGLKSGD